MTKFFANVFSILVCLTLSASQSSAAEAETRSLPKHALYGTITDAAAKQPIIGATVIITGTTTGTSTDAEGHFMITNLPKGDFTVTITYISYKTLVSQPIIIKPQTSFCLDAALVEEASELENIVVVTSRPVGTDAGLVSQMRSMNVVASGVSGQHIAKTQDKDAAEVVRRVPGISIIDDKFVIVRGLSQRYNNVWINGAAVPSSEADTRAFSFDMIPSSQLENMMIIKSPVPEIPGDFSGGFIQIRTKMLPAENSIQLSYGTGFNSRTHSNDFKYNPGSPTDLLGFDNGKRDLRPSAADRIDNNNTQQVDIASKNGFNNDWSIRSVRPIPDQKFSLAINRRYQSANGDSFGAIAAVNYSYSNKSLLDMENSRFGVYDGNSDNRVYLYKYNDNQYVTDVRLGAMLNISYLPVTRGKVTSRYEFRNLFNQIGRNKLTEREGYHVGSGYYEQRQEEYNYSSRSAYTGQLSGDHTWENTRIDWNGSYSYSNRNQPDRRIVERQKDETNGVTEYQIDQSFVSRDFISLNENLLSAGANLTHKFAPENIFSPELRAGIYGEYKNRDYNTRAFVYKWSDTSLLPEGFAALPTDQIFTEQNLGIDKIHIQDNSNNTDNYQANNSIVSAYAAINLPLGRFNIYAGARIENFRTTVTSYLSETDLRTKDRDYNYTDLLPSANVSYKLGDKSLLRLAYGMSVNRQEFRELSPSTYYDFDMFSLVMGNTSLKEATIQNIDLRYELYPGSDEIVTMALFYKHFDNPIEWTYTDGGSSYIFSFQNAASAISYGAEIDLRKNLSFIGMRNFTLTMNASWIKSEVQFEKGSLEHTRPMQGQSPYLVNAGLFYRCEKLGLSAGALYNRIGKRIVGIGRVQAGDGSSINNNIPDMYELSRNVIDLTVTKSIGKRFEIKASARDILSEPIEFKQFPTFVDGNGVVQKREQVTKKYNAGRSFSLTLSATF